MCVSNTTRTISLKIDDVNEIFNILSTVKNYISGTLKVQYIYRSDNILIRCTCGIINIVIRQSVSYDKKNTIHVGFYKRREKE